MSEQEIPESRVGPRIGVRHAQGESTRTEGSPLGVAGRGIVDGGGGVVRFYPWTSGGAAWACYSPW